MRPSNLTHGPDEGQILLAMAAPSQEVDMTSDMAFECLLVSRDPSVICIMNRLLGDLSISINTCWNSAIAFTQLSEGSTDLIIVDCEDESVDLLHRIQESGRWRKPTVIVVSSRDLSIPCAHIVLRKPVTETSGAMSLKAAYSRMLYDHRRHTVPPQLEMEKAFVR